MRFTLSIMKDMTLERCPVGSEVEIRRVTIEERYRFRLGELGLREHERIRVLQKTSFGGRVLAHGRDRMAVDGDTVSHIVVSA